MRDLIDVISTGMPKRPGEERQEELSYAKHAKEKYENPSDTGPDY